MSAVGRVILSNNNNNNRGQVISTLEELRTITTHDDNLERQYKEGK